MGYVPIEGLEDQSDVTAWTKKARAEAAAENAKRRAAQEAARPSDTEGTRGMGFDEKESPSDKP